MRHNTTQGDTRPPREIQDHPWRYKTTQRDTRPHRETQDHPVRHETTQGDPTPPRETRDHPGRHNTTKGDTRPPREIQDHPGRHKTTQGDTRPSNETRPPRETRDHPGSPPTEQLVGKVSQVLGAQSPAGVRCELRVESCGELRPGDLLGNVERNPTLKTTKTNIIFLFYIKKKKKNFISISNFISNFILNV